MENLFLRYLQAGFFGGIVIIVVLVLRLCLCKAPRQLICVLWLLAAVRLLIPFAPQSSLSLQPELPVYLSPSQQQPEQILPDADIPDAPPMPDTPQIPDVPDTPVTPSISQKESIRWEKAVFIAWVVGGTAMTLSAIISYLRLRNTVRMAVKTQPGVYVSDRITGAFVMGYWNPRVYLPADLPDEDVPHILAHEQAHIARGDHWWKLLGYICLCIHWYNPLVWVCYVLFCRDTEVACDERVVWPMELAQRKAYSHALLNCGKRYSGLTAVTLCFGKVSLAQRIKNVLSYRKPGFWITAVAGMLAVTVAICFLTVPKPEQREIDGPGATEAPAQEPTQAPTQAPTQSPTETPTEAPTAPATQAPTEAPTEAPTQAPTQAPTEAPTRPMVSGSGSCGQTLAWTLNDGVLTISGTGEMTDLSGDWEQPWADGRTQITKLNISEGVTKIGDYAFSNLTALRAVSIPANVKTIGRYAFGGCGNLADVQFAGNGMLTDIGRVAFANTAITEFTAPASLRTIQRQAFSGCSALQTVVLAGGVQTVEDMAFENCTALKKLVVGHSVTQIDRLTVFSGCEAIEYMELYVNAMSGAWGYQEQLETLVVGGSIDIVNGTNWCVSLKRITIAAGMEWLREISPASPVQEVHFLSDAPRIDANSFSGHALTAYYPANNPTWTEDKLQNYGGNVTWIAVE